MESLGQDGQHYDKCYNVYIKLSRRYEQWVDWIEAEFDDNILSELIKSISGDNTLKMLGIGCSTGKLNWL